MYNIYKTFCSPFKFLAEFSATATSGNSARGQSGEILTSCVRTAHSDALYIINITTNLIIKIICLVFNYSTYEKSFHYIFRKDDAGENRKTNPV